MNQFVRVYYSFFIIFYKNITTTTTAAVAANKVTSNKLTYAVILYCTCLEKSNALSMTKLVI